MNNKNFTYKKSGVNIKAADKFVNFISSVSSKKRGKKKFSNIGGFGSISNIPTNIKQPQIVACTDGVGTKIEISSPFNASFDKNKIINRGFVEAYEELILTIVQSKDQKKLQNSSTKEVKSLVETFSIVQENFIDEIYNCLLYTSPSPRD